MYRQRFAFWKQAAWSDQLGPTWQALRRKLLLDSYTVLSLSGCTLVHRQHNGADFSQDPFDFPVWESMLQISKSVSMYCRLFDCGIIDPSNGLHLRLRLFPCLLHQCLVACMRENPVGKQLKVAEWKWSPWTSDPLF